MGVKHKNIKAIFLMSFLPALTVASAALGFSIFTSTSVVALNGCPDQEVRGIATSTAGNRDPNKCYKFNATARAYEPTASVPDTTPATPAPSNGSTAPAPSNGSTTQQQGGNTTPPAATPPEDEVTCAVEKVGWILCPIMEGAAKMADRTFDILANNFLRIEPQLLSDGDVGPKPAWEQARSLANIMFVIAFLAIIYSQITGAGLNNYGIKRMLPRLIIAALAVNLSFYICQGMVDLSNIMGYAIKQGLSDISNTIGPSVMTGSTQGLDTQTGNGILSKITIAALALAGVAWVLLGPAMLIVTTVLITVTTVIVILLLRKAILIMLVVISPIAFVMYLLPNTEKLFDRWLKMFWGLLMVFPVVALLFGGGQLASTIILMSGSAPEPYTETSQECLDKKDQEAEDKSQETKDQEATAAGDPFIVSCEKAITITSKDSPKEANAGMMLGLVATGIAVAPLLAVWAVLKGALAAAGAIGGRIAANVQKGSQKGVGGGSKYLGEKYKGSDLGKARAYKKEVRESDIKAGMYEGKFGNKNPRNLRNKLNKRLNAIGKAEDGSYNQDSNLGNYGYFRDKQVKKATTDRIRSKAEEFETKDYDAEFHNNLRDRDNAELEHGKQSVQYREADIKVQAAKLAAGRQEGQAGVADKNAALKMSATDRKTAASSHGGNYAAMAQAQARQSAPQMPHIGGGGAPSTNQPTSQQAQRLSYNSTGATGGIVPKSGHNVIGQVEDAGGFSALSNDDLINAGRHAAQNQGGNGHDELGQKVVEELQNRGIDPNQHL